MHGRIATVNCKTTVSMRDGCPWRIWTECTGDQERIPVKDEEGSGEREISGELPPNHMLTCKVKDALRDHIR